MRRADKEEQTLNVQRQSNSGKCVKEQQQKKLALPEKLQVVDQLLKDPQVHSTLERSDANGALAGLQGLLSGLDLSKVLGRKKRSPLLGGATSSLGVSGLVDKLGLGDTLKKLALPEKLQVVDQLLKDPQVHSTLERADANGDLAGLQGLLSGLDLSKVLGRKKRSPLLSTVGKLEETVNSLDLQEKLQSLGLKEKLQVVDQLLKDPQVHSTLEVSILKSLCTTYMVCFV
uniref:uncharacterized protein LOC114602372 n=1 Tax=Podarcis muralis TaxID=64176 RepID=UPI0010A0A96B|nr:uncharacterized protein LOC114602372 [Podarcis muralis]